MSKVVRFHTEALAELAAEAVYYESKASGLGKRFTNEIEAATGIAGEFPEVTFFAGCRTSNSHARST